MKAEMSSAGVITLSPENSIEAFAMRHWTDRALVMQADEMRNESCHWRGSRLVVATAQPEDAE